MTERTDSMKEFIEFTKTVNSIRVERYHPQACCDSQSELSRKLYNEFALKKVIVSLKISIYIYFLSSSGLKQIRYPRNIKLCKLYIII